MNLYSIIAALVVAVGLWFGGEHQGRVAGTNAQKVADQAQFDQINGQLTQQKSDANEKYRQALSGNIALMSERDQLKTILEKEHEDNRRATAALRDKYAGVGLRFASSEGARLGGSCGVAQGSGDVSSSLAATTVIQLPVALTRNLRRLAFDAAELADNYRECYGYAQQVK